MKLRMTIAHFDAVYGEGGTSIKQKIMRFADIHAI